MTSDEKKHRPMHFSFDTFRGPGYKNLTMAVKVHIHALMAARRAAASWSSASYPRTASGVAAARPAEGRGAERPASEGAGAHGSIRPMLLGSLRPELFATVDLAASGHNLHLDPCFGAVLRKMEAAHPG